MSAASARIEIIYSEEGVVATRSQTGFYVCLPRPTSLNHLLGVVGSLWEVWKASRTQVYGAAIEWKVNVSELDELPLPLIAVMSAIDADLTTAQRKLIVVSAPQTTSTPIRKY